jgi:lysophospholipase L1-like esterase
MYWLGSSVTLGMCSEEYAVADYIAAQHDVTCIKEAVSGTTLIDADAGWGKKSYVYRLQNSTNFSKEQKIDAFVCQISTNDAKSENVDNWGRLTSLKATNIDAFNVKTTLGAMEYIVAYVEQTWDCPIYFYSGSYFGNTGERGSSNPKGSDYAKLVQKTRDLAEKWNEIEGYEVRVIDLFNDEEFNNITDEQYGAYMKDPIHPYKRGYVEWWTPAFEKVFLEDFGK